MAATQHLIDLGHRRIAFLGGRADLESARLREAGFRDAMRRAGLSVDPALVADGGFRRETAAAPARALLDRTDRPTAVFAANDLSAIETMHMARELGLRVPQDVSIIGFDNVPESALTDPPLTTVDQSIQQLGEVAANMLIECIERPQHRLEPPTLEPPTLEPPTEVRLPASIVVRHSTAEVSS
jgi:LacI family transcriptional regulator